MTSIFGQTIVPKAGVEEALPVWMKIDWRPEIEKGIYIDWGKYYSRRGRVNHALTYLNKASELAPEDVMILYNRSKNLRRIGKSHSALENCKTARKILKSSLGPQSYPINLETCDALYELNRFEDAKAEAHNSANLFSSNKTQAFEDRLLVIDENIRDCCGDGLTPFILKNQNIITHVQDLENNKMKIDERPLWKILKEEGKCDVLSIPEIKSQQLSPREIARRRRAYDICNQYYLDKSWKDIHSAIHDLDRNPNVLMPQCRNSHKFLETLIKQQYKIVQKFAKMIHSRSPMYYMRYNKHADKTLSDKFMEDQLSRIQYQTRRNMVSVLRTIRRLREEQNISKLSKYVEEVMGEYVVLKTFRIMPWKFEFINEVYNTLALALAEQYYVPSKFKFNERKAFHHLLHLETDKIKDTPQFVFGDRSTYQDITAMDLSGIKSRRQISNLENRMIFAKYSIEKCYLLHQIANIHLDSNRYEECGFTARKAIEESKNCNSLLWSFLCTILIVKSNASLNKFERAKEALKNAMQIATDLDCHNLVEFVEMSFSCLERISIKGSLSNPSSHRGSKSSVGSTNSM